MEAIPPSYVKEAFERRATEIDYFIAALSEMALANALEGESPSFEVKIVSFLNGLTLRLESNYKAEQNKR